MRRPGALAGLLALLTLTGCGGGATHWKRFQAPEWGYAVDYPSDPKVTIDVKSGSRMQMSLVGDDSRGKRLLGVVTIDVPGKGPAAEGLSPDQADQTLSAMATALARLLGASASAPRRLELGDQRWGRDFEMAHVKRPGVRGTGRLILDGVRRRIYFAVMLADSAGGREDIARFLASFQITDEPR